MVEKIIVGEDIKNYIPKNRIEDIVLSFKDHELDFEKDLQYCDLHITKKGTCWLHDTRKSKLDHNGTLIATFHNDGSSFIFTKSKRGDERMNTYNDKRHEFFKVKRTASEIKKFEEENLMS